MNGFAQLQSEHQLSFFHTTPSGRIINRLTKDTADVDRNLMDFTAMFLRGFLQLFSTVALIGVVTPFALPAIVPILLAFYFMYSYFQVINDTFMYRTFAT